MSPVLHWLVAVEADPRLDRYCFRVALRLASKVRSEDLRVDFAKFRAIADTQALTSLKESGLLTCLGNSKCDRRREQYQLHVAEMEIC